MPTWYGHAFNNPKDIPFATLHVWALWALTRALREAPRLPLARAVELGAAIGLTGSVRGAGLVILLYLVAAYAAVLGTWARTSGAPAMTPLLCALVPRAAVTFLLACGVPLLFWPWLAEAPLAHLAQALHSSVEFHWSQWVLYAGRFYAPTSLPWHYVPVWLTIQTPLLVLALTSSGVVFLWTAARQGRPLAWWLPRALLLTAALFPIALAVARRPVLYDAARHFLFVLPPIAVLAALGADALWRRVGARARVRHAAGALVVLALAVHVTTLVRLHPYQYVFFNELVGGLAGAGERFESDYWAHSFQEAARALVQRLRERDGPLFAQRVYRVVICGPPVPATHSWPPNVVRVRDIQEADFALILRRNRCNREFRERTPLFTVGRSGVVFTYVYDLHRPQAEGVVRRSE
jgi:hypothetical protein